MIHNKSFAPCLKSTKHSNNASVIRVIVDKIKKKTNMRYTHNVMCWFLNEMKMRHDAYNVT